MPFKIVGVNEENLFPDRVEQRLGATFASKSESATKTEVADLVNIYAGKQLESVVDDGRLSKPGTKRYDTTSGFRKKVVHNLVYMHADWNAATTAWGLSLFPQTFVIDDVADEILTISNDGIVSVYDMTSGAYKGRVFKLTGVVATNQSAVIRRINGQRYLYARKSNTVFSRWNITTLPAPLAEIVSANDYNIGTISDFAFANNGWYMGAYMSDTGTAQYQSRGKFFHYDENFAILGAMSIDSMHYGGNIGGGDYALSGFPKSQGLAAGNGVFVSPVGGGWNTGETRPITDSYFYHGVRAYNSKGDMIAESLTTAETMWNYFDSLGYQPNHIETQGATYAYGKFYALYTIAASGTPAAATGGLVIMEEFSQDDAAVDFSANAVSWTATDTVTNSVRATLAPDGNLLNLVTGGTLNTIPDIMDFMLSVGQSTISFASSVTSVADPDGNQFPTGLHVECRILTPTTMQVETTGGAVSILYTYWWTGSVWKWDATDTGWIDLVIPAPHAALNVNERPRVRRKDGVLYYQGAISNAGLTANAIFTVATLPAGSVNLSPGINRQSATGSSSGSAVASINVSTGGDIQLRTGATVGNYYSVSPLSGSFPANY